MSTAMEINKRNEKKILIESDGLGAQKAWH